MAKRIVILLVILFILIAVFLIRYSDNLQGAIYDKFPALAEVSAQVTSWLPGSKTIHTDIFIVYIPEGVSREKIYPLIIAFSPDADATGMIKFWKGMADRHELIIVASKEFQNGVNPDSIFQRIIAEFPRLFSSYPIDKSKVIVSGFSGGGMASHMFSADYPDKVKAVITNCGVIHPVYIKDEYKYPCPRNKLAVFLASPADFNYKKMKSDQLFLKNHGWKTKWIEFNGGHSFASPSAYSQAISWILKQ